MIQEDVIAVQRLFLTIYHAARIITRDAHRRNELVLVNEQFKEALGKSEQTYRVLESYQRIGSRNRYRSTRLYNLLLRHRFLQTSSLILESIMNKHKSKNNELKQQARAAFFSQQDGFGRGPLKRNLNGIPQFDIQLQYQYPMNNFCQQTYPSSQFQHNQMQQLQLQSALYASQPIMFNPNVQTSQWFTPQYTFISQQQIQFASKLGNAVQSVVPKQPLLAEKTKRNAEQEMNDMDSADNNLENSE
ncbi:MAG: hypothetical protein EZS28_011122 [Streblomastix strix]|uniref:Uncharacterized protein n=1 Tax=Streblomastix strix TaxID=222440 RepID=A0A5J4WEG1_9EUKA|nr:MAG: hypothetical protein EZS28_011122 [Streblomastix strix]